MSLDLRQRVARERKLRYNSDREAAQAGGVSNTTWGRYMAGGELTDTMRHAVAKAYGWRSDWPENPPPDFSTEQCDVIYELVRLNESEAKTLTQIRDRLQRLETKVDQLLTEPTPRQPVRDRRPA